jgi:hypothetical protein
MTPNNWTEILALSLRDLWGGFVGAIPAVIGALIVLIIGLLVASGLGLVVDRIFTTIKLNTLLQKAGLERYFKRAGLELNTGRFFGKLTYWFILIAFFLAAADILRFTALSGFLKSVLLYIPNVVVAALILLVTVVIAGFLRKLVHASVKSANLKGANFLSTLSWWSVIIFGLFAALTQLGIAVTIISTLLTGVVAMIAIAGGIAFGMGGRDYAAHLINKFRNQVEE